MWGYLWYKEDVCIYYINLAGFLVPGSSPFSLLWCKWERREEEAAQNKTKIHVCVCVCGVWNIYILYKNNIKHLVEKLVT